MDWSLFGARHPTIVGAYRKGITDQYHLQPGAKSRILLLRELANA
jgi:hypothetical protein